jgi:uncharacterized protein YcbK (DUF882 family)
MRNFIEKEFDSPDLPGSGSLMSPLLLQLLDDARDKAGISFNINSGYRTQKHNDSLKHSKPDSSHVKGLAVDIAVIGSRERYLILEALLSVGITRLGIGDNFIHADIDESKAQNVVWGY